MGRSSSSPIRGSTSTTRLLRSERTACSQGLQLLRPWYTRLSGHGVHPWAISSGLFERHRLASTSSPPSRCENLTSGKRIRTSPAISGMSLERIPRKWRPTPIQFKNEPLVFTQSDVDKSNSILDPTGRLYFVDFETGIAAPVYTVKMSPKPFVQGAASCLPSQTSPNLASMQRARSILWMCADTTLGTLVLTYQ
ncbi:hypothetical protein V8B97DRAFT_1609685 [Scleroderma yunnanense]